MRLVDKVGLWAMGFAFGVFLAITIATWGDAPIWVRAFMIGSVVVMGIAPLLPKWKSRRLKTETNRIGT
jgi:hypothetical protein